MSEIETWLAELAERPRRAGTRDVTRLLALVRQYREALEALINYAVACEGLLNATEAGQVKAARAALEAMPHD